jgi:hypothetical protein
MKNILSVFTALLAILVSVAPLRAEAHVLEQDGAVQGVMHLNPSHEPTAGEPAQFEFFMSGTKGHPYPTDAYQYALVIQAPDGATSSASVIGGGSTLKAPYTFPKQGDYTATFTGSSTQPGVPNFSLVYDDIHVLPSGTHQNPIASFFGEHGGYALITGILILILIGAYVWDRFLLPRFKKKS